MAEQTKRAAAYVAWGTFRNCLDRFSEGLPARVDKTVFPGLSGGTQSQLITSMKFLGLVEADGTPTPELRGLVGKNELERKPLLKKIFEDAYPEVMALNLAKATPAQLGEQMEEAYGVTGSTRTKAMRFFLNGAKAVGISLSPFLKKPVKSPRRSSTRKRRTKSDNGNGDAPSATQSGTSKTVTLQSGGVLTLSATLDIFSLSPEDRTFVFTFIDQMEMYERDHIGSRNETPNKRQESDGGEPSPTLD